MAKSKSDIGDDEFVVLKRVIKPPFKEDGAGVYCPSCHKTTFTQDEMGRHVKDDHKIKGYLWVCPLKDLGCINAFHKSSDEIYLHVHFNHYCPMCKECCLIKCNPIQCRANQELARN